MPKRHFLTFASSNMKSALARIRTQAEQSGLFNGSILTLTEAELEPTFRRRFANYLTPTVRGFGYWAWKPQILLQALHTIPENDLLCYVDAGSTIRHQGAKMMEEWWEKAANEGIVCFEGASFPDAQGIKHIFLPEYAWTKGDLFDWFDCRQKMSVVQSAQIGAGILIFKNTASIRSLVRQWLVVYEKRFDLADDSHSASPNFQGFIEHRHDQSIFSLLIKTRTSVRPISACYYCPSGSWAPRGVPKRFFGGISFLSLYDSPIWATRIRGSWRDWIPLPLKYLFHTVSGTIHHR